MDAKDHYQFEVGEVVLIASDDKKRLEYPMARILQLIKGTDGNIRVAKVKTSGGVLTRPLQRLIPMEISSNDDQISLDTDTKSRMKKSQVNTTE